MRIFLLSAFLIAAIGINAQENTGQHAAPAFTVNESRLHIESIAYDSKRKQFYLGSINKRKIIVINEKGVARNFITPAQDGIWSVLGMKVSPDHRYLWVTTTALPFQEEYDANDDGKTGIFRYDLQTGKLVKKYILHEAGQKHGFGDLVIDNKGIVYATDSNYPAIYSINPATDSLELFYSTSLRSLQGLALGNADKHLYIADYSSGLYQLDLQNKHLKPLQDGNTTMPVKGIDGLYYEKGALYGIQNGSPVKRILAFALSRQKNSIVSYKILDENNAALDEPTLGVIVSQKLYFVANSPWGYYTKDNKMNETGKLRKMQILYIKL